MKVGLAQYNFTVGDFNENLKKIFSVMQSAEKHACDLLIFPELALSGYIPEDLLQREDFLDASEKALAHLTSQVKSMAVIVGCPIKREGQVFNAAVILQHQKQIAYYAKQILPNYGVFDEKRYFSAGQETCVFELQGFPKMALLICEDVWFTEPALAAKRAGAEVLLSLHASPFAVSKAQQRQEAYRAVCQASGLPMLAVMTVGAQDELCFDGGSCVLNTAGECVQQADFFKEQLMMVEVMRDCVIPNVVRNLNEHSDEVVSHIYQALVLGIRDYVHKNHFKGALLGLSGGIDSALTLMLAIDALGAENVTAVALPSRYTSELSMRLFHEQVKLTGVESITMSIEALYESSLATLEPAFRNLPHDKTEENLQARCRGILLMALSNKIGRILLTTGNKSEMAMGYTTLYGDMCGGFSALKDVYKTTVFELARYRNRICEQIPEEIITRAPSAELAAGQTDQDTLPPYEVLDEILRRSIDLQQSIEDIVAAGFDEGMVKKVVRAVYLNEYKRRQSPPGIKITEVSFTRERRYPMTNGFE